MAYYTTATELGVYDMWQLQRERNKFTKFYLDKWNACEGLDVILSPTSPYTSVKHGDWQSIGYVDFF